MKARSTGGGIVYSTEHGRMCSACGAPVAACLCREESAPTGGDGIVRVGRETKGRKGAGVTLITGVPVAPAELAALCSRLKRRCGSGGTVKDGTIEIQGDHRESVAEELRKNGWTVKIAGG